MGILAPAYARQLDGTSCDHQRYLYGGRATASGFAINRGCNNEGSSVLNGFDPSTVGLHQQQQPAGACEDDNCRRPPGFQDDRYLSGRNESALLMRDRPLNGGRR
jgi:hypothetical protein